MPRVTIRTGITSAGGTEEVLTEYLCDWADCANVAEHAVGFARELAGGCAVCSEHAAMLRICGSDSGTAA